MSIGSFKLERESLLVGEKITLKLWCLRILAIEKLEFGKKGNMILILGLEWEGCDPCSYSITRPHWIFFYFKTYWISKWLKVVA